jgi:hypothetical protein
MVFALVYNFIKMIPGRVQADVPEFTVLKLLELAIYRLVSECPYVRVGMSISENHRYCAS